MFFWILQYPVLDNPEKKTTGKYKYCKKNKHLKPVYFFILFYYYKCEEFQQCSVTITL